MTIIVTMHKNDERWSSLYSNCVKTVKINALNHCKRLFLFLTGGLRWSKPSRYSRQVSLDIRTPHQTPTYMKYEFSISDWLSRPVLSHPVLLFTLILSTPSHISSYHYYINSYYKCRSKESDWVILEKNSLQRWPQARVFGLELGVSLNQRPFGLCSSTCALRKEAAELMGGRILLSARHMIKYNMDSTTSCYFITVPDRTSYFLIK